MKDTAVVPTESFIQWFIPRRRRPIFPAPPSPDRPRGCPGTPRPRPAAGSLLEGFLKIEYLASQGSARGIEPVLSEALAFEQLGTISGQHRLGQDRGSDLGWFRNIGGGRGGLRRRKNWSRSQVMGATLATTRQFGNLLRLLPSSSALLLHGVDEGKTTMAHATRSKTTSERSRNAGPKAGIKYD